MSLVDWKEMYSVNVSVVDNQHKRLIEIINTLHEALSIGKGKDILNSVLQDLVDYTVYHFGTEEKYFDSYRYPDSELHKKQHRDLIDQVSELHKRNQAGERVLTIEVMNFLRDWLLDHIVGSDKKYGPFLNSKGVF